MEPHTQDEIIESCREALAAFDTLANTKVKVNHTYDGKTVATAATIKDLRLLGSPAPDTLQGMRDLITRYAGNIATRREP